MQKKENTLYFSDKIDVIRNKGVGYEKNIDLHMHSLYSDDGELSPEDIIKIGKKEGMDIMALTDHNSVKGVDEMIKHGEEAGIRI